MERKRSTEVISTTPTTKQKDYGIFELSNGRRFGLGIDSGYSGCNSQQFRELISLINISNTDLKKLGQIEKLARIIWTEHYTPIIGIDQVNYMLTKFQSLDAMKSQINEGYSYFGLFEQTHLIGYFSYQIRSTTLFISKIYIDFNKRGKGYFSIILNKLEQIATENSCKCLELTVNKYNKETIAIYEKKGFTKTTEAIFDIGHGYIMDDYIMQKYI